MTENEKQQWEKISKIKGFEALGKYKSLPLCAAAGLLDKEFFKERLKDYDEKKAVCDQVRTAFLESNDEANKTKEGVFDTGYQFALSHCWMEISQLKSQMEGVAFALKVASETLTAIREDSKVGPLLEKKSSIDEKTWKKFEALNDDMKAQMLKDAFKEFTDNSRTQKFTEAILGDENGH